MSQPKPHIASSSPAAHLASRKPSPPTATQPETTSHLLYTSPDRALPSSNLRRSSPHSSSSSVASTAGSSSPSSYASSTNLAMSNVNRADSLEPGRARAASTHDSVGSLATTLSPMSDANKEDAMEGVVTDEASTADVTEVSQENAGQSGSSINLSGLSIKQEDGETEAHDQPSTAGAAASTPCSHSPRERADPQRKTGDDAVRNRQVEPTIASSASPSTHTSVQPSRSDSDLAPTPNLSTSSTNHVEIVSYPSHDLLRLLASLLEQIAQANDARNERVAAAAAAAAQASSDPTAATSSQSTEPSSPKTRISSLQHKGDDDNFNRGRFDAAPLNTPVTPHHARRFTKIGGSGGPGILDNALNEDYTEDQAAADELPVTPGVDLLREVGQGGGVEGFMPSLGGTHQPMPLTRRRGSSFVRNRRPDDPFARPSNSRQTSSMSSSQQPMRPSPSSSNESSPMPSRRPSHASHVASALPSPLDRPSAAPSNPTEPPLTSLFSASSVALSSPNATLCFHARNVPAISIEAYLLRILKYCPTTNEVFLALLVYFDRMARIGLEAQRLGLPEDGSRDGTSGSGEGTASVTQASKLFAIDSFNVHRLVIAGVTVASKFFSDVFYTNSRYAKVGGLPLHELNQLELQFLLLNDFRLKVPVDELQRYADQLILFWIGRNGTSNPPAAAAQSVDNTNSVSSTNSRTGPTASMEGERAPTPTHAPSSHPAAAAAARSTPAQLTHSAVAAHHESSSESKDRHSRGGEASVHNSQTPTIASSSTSTYMSKYADRPRSVRSQPSSSGTSVTSTITPGTPSTTRDGSSSDSESDNGGPNAGSGTRGRTSWQSGKTNRIEPSEDGHYHDGWSSNESSRESSAERNGRYACDQSMQVDD
ncbi:PHO85 cyclin family protein [Sporobolomyces koalae]|uniref:PHO85 cyclin family protein n=1 Tax=Sporobolomyces koalae TaxID=500713 RepID=UPI003174DFC5